MTIINTSGLPPAGGGGWQIATDDLSHYIVCDGSSVEITQEIIVEVTRPAWYLVITSFHLFPTKYSGTSIEIADLYSTGTREQKTHITTLPYGLYIEVLRANDTLQAFQMDVNSGDIMTNNQITTDTLPSDVTSKAYYRLWVKS